MSAALIRRLFRAAAHGDVAQIAQLLDQDTALAAVERADGSVALHEACVHGQEGAARLLVARGAPLDARRAKMKTPLHEACTHGHAGVAALLLDAGAGVDLHKTNAWTALHYAASGGHVAVVRLLLQRGALIDDVNREHATPLYLAARGGHDECVAVLLDGGADAALATSNRRTPLMRCARRRLRCAPEFTCARGAPAAVALSAVSNGHASTARLLLNRARGAGLAEQDTRGFTAWHMCSELEGAGGADVLEALLAGACSGDEACVAWLRLAPGSSDGDAGPEPAPVASGTLDQLLPLPLTDTSSLRPPPPPESLHAHLHSAGADLRDSLGRRPLHTAALRGNAAFVRRWLQVSPDLAVALNDVDGDGCSPAYLAVAASRPDLVRLLLRAGADPAIACARRAPLHMAVSLRDEAAARACTAALLAAAGARGADSTAALLSAVDQDGRTAAALAASRGGDVGAELAAMLGAAERGALVE